MEKSGRRSRAVSRILEELASGTVIVEGKHDVKALASLGISAIPEGSISRRPITGKGRVYILMDDDRRGIQRKEALIGKLLEIDGSMDMDTVIGTRLQRMLNITSVEQLCKPVAEALNR